MSAVEEAIRAWEIFRKGTIAELENIPEEKWDYRPGEGARTLRELALHIAEAGVGFTMELLKPDTSFMRLRDPQVQAELRAGLPRAQSRTETIDLIRTTGAQNVQRLREASDWLAAQTMPLFSDQQSRASGIWFAAADEMYHRGQLATYARGVGRVPAMTQQMARQAAKR